MGSIPTPGILLSVATIHSSILSRLAQSVERQALTLAVVGSSPTVDTYRLFVVRAALLAQSLPLAGQWGVSPCLRFCFCLFFARLLCTSAMHLTTPAAALPPPVLRFNTPREGGLVHVSEGNTLRHKFANFKHSSESIRTVRCLSASRRAFLLTPARKPLRHIRRTAAPQSPCEPRSRRFRA